MASLTSHFCATKKPTATKLLARLAGLALPHALIKVCTEFAGRKPCFYVPVAYYMALDNLEHVLVDCDYFKLEQAVPRSGSVVVDAGAFLGFYSVASSTLAGRSGRVVAVEANPGILGYLKLNLDYNKAYNTLLIPRALCSHTGFTKLYIGAYPAVSSTIRSHVEEHTRVERAVEVKCLKLSTLLSYLGFTNVLKLDVEGLELELLREASSALHRVKTVVVEVHTDVVEVADIEEELARSGFTKIVLYAVHEAPSQVVAYGFRN